MSTDNPFDFDDSGQFLLAQMYIAGAAMQLDRYQEALVRKDKSKVTSLFVQFHEVSCLLEDLACISEYFNQANFPHPKDKLWKQARHHIRHDIRDKNGSDQAKGQTKKRLKFLQMKRGMISQISFASDAITVGSIKIDIGDVKSYIDWANEIMGGYIDYNRASGKLKNE